MTKKINYDYKKTQKGYLRSWGKNIFKYRMNSKSILYDRNR